MNNHEENKASKWEQVQAKMKRLMKKRWALPAVYLTLSAVVLSSFLWMTSTDDLTDEQRDSEFDIEESADESTEGLSDVSESTEADEEEAVPAVSHDEVFELPVVDENEVAVVGIFHDFEASVEDQEQAFIRYNNYFYQNRGIDLARDDNQPFDVSAAMSGTVVKAEEDALFGQVVHIEHEEDILTIYQSLDGVTVEPGQTVKQGDVIGQAGRNLYNTDAGVHAHFEIRKDNVPVNPLDYVDQTLTALPDFTDEEQDEQQAPEEVPEPEEEIEQERGMS
ncbi:M23 family metallopeptidase [Salipaludibacillus sp. CUR1]|uniref:M23 family metallopeptidase n=1 Tax=Salipaludibacillus sp. CUR1 TaxID=2820003 RepID=UPI001E449402|nr:M23 family metallopeptidase [Salipaludibacillus sp. CUR1]MCE7792394.1 M23 family metallopeptidase [Salipaludibacillus sp. CUR1]